MYVYINKYMYFLISFARMFACDSCTHKIQDSGLQRFLKSPVMDKYRKVMKPKVPLAAKWEVKNWKPVDHCWSVLDCPKNWPVKDLKDFRSFFKAAEIS